MDAEMQKFLEDNDIDITYEEEMVNELVSPVTEA